LDFVSIYAKINGKNNFWHSNWAISNPKIRLFSIPINYKAQKIQPMLLKSLATKFPRKPRCFISSAIHATKIFDVSWTTNGTDDQSPFCKNKMWKIKSPPEKNTKKSH
jgi:hypothetical protein